MPKECIDGLEVALCQALLHDPSKLDQARGLEPEDFTGMGAWGPVFGALRDAIGAGDKPDHRLIDLRLSRMGYKIPPAMHEDPPETQTIAGWAAQIMDRGRRVALRKAAEDVIANIERPDLSRPRARFDEAWQRFDARGGDRNGLKSVLMSEVEAKEVEWLWGKRIPFGMLSIIEGDQDKGKSLLLHDIPARFTTDRTMPFESAGHDLGRVILWAPEDAAEQVIQPRLSAAGADQTRVRLITDLLTLPEDVCRLEALIRDNGARLLIIEPLTAAFGRLDSHKDAEIRRALMPLAALAERTGCAVVAIRHLNKGSGPAAYRGGGSVAIGATARSVLVAGVDPEAPEVRILARVKGNLSAPAPSLRYTFAPVGRMVRIEWLDECQITADELLRRPDERRPSDGADSAKAMRKACEVIRSILEHGPVPTADLDEQAQAAGVKPATLRRAKRHLGVRPTHEPGPRGRWVSSLPDDQNGLDGGDGQDAQDGRDGQDGAWAT